MWQWYKNIQRYVFNFVAPGSGDLIWGGSEQNSNPTGVDVTGQYGDSPNVTVQSTSTPLTWFQKIWQTVVTVVLIAIGIIVLLIIFKGYKFVSQFFKLKS